MGSWSGDDALTELGDPGLEQVYSSPEQPLHLEACLLVLAEEDPGPQVPAPPLQTLVHPRLRPGMEGPLHCSSRVNWKPLARS